ncbi:organic hydroperoxide resistance protein [Dyella nitratireducens]|uniref:Peroxiredoxin n=1 Tax=Dyella nitratireducens TaxID=1849580 RepID=A0ABQ1G9W3_9GAMM|nr:organic hydroperoxide resistance protein [Dyella nitratireducens]GGA39497.1 peroxiredoxin [Dyella nitratireducens]GLQ40448.1 peroxiredoxin [Dyella nitratireducens]
MSILYTAKTTTTGGRNGQSRSDDHRLDIKLSLPGSSGTGTNPEQLFAAGWSACFIGAMGRAAQEIGITLPADTSVAAEVDLGNDVEEGFFLQARLNVSLPGLEHAVAQSLVDRAHQICPYSKATRGNIQAVVAAI